jgi:hypothetical protein
MKFSNQRNENVAPKVSGLPTLAQKQQQFLNQHCKPVWQLGNSRVLFQARKRLQVDPQAGVSILMH